MRVHVAVGALLVLLSLQECFGEEPTPSRVVELRVAHGKADHTYFVYALRQVDGGPINRQVFYGDRKLAGEDVWQDASLLRATGHAVLTEFVRPDADAPRAMSENSDNERQWVSISMKTSDAEYSARIEKRDIATMRRFMRTRPQANEFLSRLTDKMGKSLMMSAFLTDETENRDVITGTARP